jgi:hypothetical protein
MAFGLHASPCFMTQNNSGRVLHNNHFGKHKKYSSKTSNSMAFPFIDFIGVKTPWSLVHTV